MSLPLIFLPCLLSFSLLCPLRSVDGGPLWSRGGAEEPPSFWSSTARISQSPQSPPPAPSASSLDTKQPPPRDAEPEEALKPGALYAECAVVKLDIARGYLDLVDDKEKEWAGENMEGKQGKEIPDDGELGGERAGRAVWEAYEVGVREWEGRWKEREKEEGERDGEGEEGGKAR
ncbi:hypothetical protein R3P38DRAFT_3177807 [Favolaschia claudopus]|uniref:Uncharacterized protein n=1 Tax=Favolaschia claudopus TaxID=2862362 RepID=A0AAW0CUB3_9AGAR